ncbi:Immunoglobulin-like domain [Trinorchestia longiramus]|nr:Immunoglobulin-like domain [Trinorchestia longiramus]
MQPTGAISRTTALSQLIDLPSPNDILISDHRGDSSPLFGFTTDSTLHLDGHKKLSQLSTRATNTVREKLKQLDLINFPPYLSKKSFDKYRTRKEDFIKRDRTALLEYPAYHSIGQVSRPSYVSATENVNGANVVTNFNCKLHKKCDAQKFSSIKTSNQTSDTLPRLVQRRSADIFHHDSVHTMTSLTAMKSEHSHHPRQQFLSQEGSPRSAHLLRHGHFPSSFKSYTHLGIANSYPRTTQHWAQNADVQMPLVWLEEPKTEVLFSNDTGAVVSCAATTAGGAPADVAWTAEDGRPFLPVPELVEVLSNGSLWLLPFAGHRYDAAVHRATVSCTVSSDQGALISRPSHIKAVVSSHYEVQVYDQVVTAGNIAVLRCQVPTEMTDILKVKGWLVDGTINIFPSLYGDGSHHMLPDGVLLVTPAQSSGSHHTYQCRALHSLTGATVLSPYPARVIVTGKQHMFALLTLCAPTVIMNGRLLPLGAAKLFHLTPVRSVSCLLGKQSCNNDCGLRLGLLSDVDLCLWGI